MLLPTFFFVSLSLLASLGATQRPATVPEISWGKCPQLQPTNSDRDQKREVIERCLQAHPPPNALQLTRDIIEKHREMITTCALRTEGWFNPDGSYRFDRAKGEIQSKKLDRPVEMAILQKHETCKAESIQHFPEAFIEQVQLYQACMDYHISEVCEIEVLNSPEDLGATAPPLQPQRQRHQVRRPGPH